jgi:acyl-CoA thioester hydrolase
MRYVYNGKYIEYFEVGRTEMIREQNLTYKTIEENGYLMPVNSVFIKYKNPAYYDELLEVETRVEKLPELKVHLDHTIRSIERDVIICEGYVDLVFINSNTKKICRPPVFFMNVLKPFFDQNSE